MTIVTLTCVGQDRRCNHLKIEYPKGEVKHGQLRREIYRVAEFEHFEQEFGDCVAYLQEDCDNFFANHWGKNDLVFDDLLDYRESKIEMADMSFDIFEETCNNKGIKKGFETTFLNYLSPHDVKFIESKIASKRITLNEIYTRFIKNPNQSVLKNML